MPPEHLHLLLNHFPIVGLAVALIPLVIGIATRHRTTIGAGLIAVLLCAGTIPFVMETGEEAAERFGDDKIAPPLDEAGSRALMTHGRLAERASKPVYAAAILAAIGLLTLWKFPRALFPVAIVTLVIAAIGVAACIQTADAGGKIRHPEFRQAP